MLLFQLVSASDSLSDSSELEIVMEWLKGPLGYVLAGIFGALWGSFANVCIYRMPPTEEHPNGRSVSTPPSHCFECGSKVRWYDNVPLLAFLWLKGACRDCGATFSPRYLFVEAATAMLFVAAFHYVMHIAFVDESSIKQFAIWGIYAAFLWTMVVITFIDIDHKLILDRVTYKAIPLFYGLGLFLPGRHYSDGLIGALVGYGVVRLISDGYKMLTGRFGMGYGDGKLLAIVGALLGWQAVVISLFAGSVFGSVISIALLSWQKRKSQSVDGDSTEGIGQMEVPFGPFLVMGAISFLFLVSWFRLKFGLLWGDMPI